MKGRWGERGYTEHCLKRIAFEDESVWADVKKEIAVMVRSAFSVYGGVDDWDIRKPYLRIPILRSILGQLTPGYQTEDMRFLF